MENKGKKVCIVDYGSGNVGSVYNILRSIHDDIRVSNDPVDLDAATHIVLPGVGAFGAAIAKVKALPSFKVLQENVLLKKKPYLGICVGMQILADEGLEHGRNEGLGWIRGKVKRIEAPGLHLPHVGWNDFTWCQTENPLFKGITAGMDFYYVHSYQFETSEKDDRAATCTYGMDFTAVVNKENIYGVQFHPEKSQKAGKKLIENFLSL
jgi:glutamine amidotransferase